MTLPLYNNMCHLFVNPNLHSVFTIKCKNKTSKWPEFLAGFSYSLKLKRMWENFQLLAKICENVCRRGRQINFWYISMPVHTFSHVRLATWISSAMQYFPVVQFFSGWTVLTNYFLSWTVTLVYVQITLLWHYFTLEITLGSRWQFSSSFQRKSFQ